jgi:O-antigen/teichoic acid export membrane protein
MNNTNGISDSGITSNLARVSVSNGVSLVVGFTSSILLARWLDPGTRGLYALIWAASITLAAILGNNTWSQAFSYFSGKKRYTPAQITGHSILIVFACTVFIFILLIILPEKFIASFLPDLCPTHLWIIVFLAATNLLFSMFTGLIIGLGQISLFASLNLTRAVATLVLQLFLLGILGLGIEGALAELVISAFLVLCITFWFFIWKNGVDFNAKAGFVKDVFVYGGKTYPGHIGVMLLNRVDIYFVALFGGVVAAGLYAVARGLLEITTIIEQSISQVVTPSVIAADFSSATAVVVRAFRASFWLSGVVLLVAGFTASWLIPLIYGQEYTGAVTVFLLLLPGFLFLTTRILGTFFSMQIGRPEIPTIYILFFGLLSLPVSYFLGRQFGYLGVAAAFSLVAVLRGIAAIILFLMFSDAKLKDVMVLSKADLVWIPQLIFGWFDTRRVKDHTVY